MVNYFRIVLVQVLLFCLTGIMAQENEAECPEIFSFKFEHATCWYDNNGSVFIEAIEPLTGSFRLVNVSENRILREFTKDLEFLFLTTGKYRLIYSDSAITCFKDFQIEAPPELILRQENIRTISKPSKNYNDGVISLHFSGGTPEYVISIEAIDKNFSKTIESRQTRDIIFANLASGVYNIFITDSKGCKSSIIQYELLSQDNFNFSFFRQPKTCNRSSLFKITISEGLAPFQVVVLKNSSPVYSKTFSELNDFILSDTVGANVHFMLNEYGSYEVIIKDRRNQPVSFPFIFEDIQCRLNPVIQLKSEPTIQNPNGGKLLLFMQDGTAPFHIRCINNFSKQSVADVQIKSHSYPIEDLSEGFYQIFISDVHGRSFDTVIYIKTMLPDRLQAKAEFEKSKSEFYRLMNICDCNRQQIQNLQILLKVGVALLGMTGNIASAGTGSMIAGIASGIVTTAGLFSDDIIPNKKLEQLNEYFYHLQYIKGLYDKFDVSMFDESVWSAQNAMEFDNIKEHIKVEMSKYKLDFIPYCKESKMKRKFGSE